MADMLYEQIMLPRYAPCETLAGPFEKTFMDKHSIFMNLKTDDQFNNFNSLSNAVLEPIADMQKCDELLVQPNLSRSPGQLLIATDPRKSP